MAVTSLARSSLSSPVKYDSFLAGAHTSVFQLIQTVTVGSGGASSVTFSNIPQTYTHLEIRWICRSTDAGGVQPISMRCNSDTGNNYVAYHFVQGNGSSASSSNFLTLDRAMAGVAGSAAVSSPANVFGSGILNILDYTSTSKNKTFRALSGTDNNGSGTIALGSALWISTSAITALQILQAGGTLTQHTTFSLYGVL